MHFAITNDDGYDATGLAILVRVARKFGTADVVAPLHQQSRTGHSISLGEPLEVRRLTHGDVGPIHVVNGTPADCTRLVVMGLAGRKPDWFLAGINHGANLGVDVFYSSTVAAAREAALHGLPAIALSQFIRQPREVDWDGAALMTERVMRELFSRRCPAGTHWNVNLPALENGFEQVTIVEAPMATDPLPLSYEETEAPTRSAPDPEGARYYRYTGRYLDRVRAPGSDVDVAFADRIAITPLGLRPDRPDSSHPHA